MATLAVIDSYAVGQPSLQTRFRAARLQVAWNILAESGATTNHAARLAWAKKIFANYDADDTKEYLWHLSHANIQSAGAAITDANLVTAVASFVDDWSV
jgi:hypothetical protein